MARALVLFSPEIVPGCDPVLMESAASDAARCTVPPEALDDKYNELVAPGIEEEASATNEHSTQAAATNRQGVDIPDTSAGADIPSVEFPTSRGRTPLFVRILHPPLRI